MSDREVLKSLLDQMGYQNKFSYIFKNHVRLDGESIVRLKLKLDREMYARFAINEADERDNNLYMVLTDDSRDTTSIFRTAN